MTLLVIALLQTLPVLPNPMPMAVITPPSIYAGASVCMGGITYLGKEMSERPV
jgi:hypothetical protein